MSYHRQKQEGTKGSLLYCLHQAFPCIYGYKQRQGDHYAQLTESMIKKHLSYISKNNSMFTKSQDFQHILSSLILTLNSNTQKQPNYPLHNYKILPQYGCALMLVRETSVSNVSVYVIFGVCWDLGMQINQKQVKQFQSIPKQHQYFLIGQIESSEVTLYQVMKVIDDCIIKFYTESSFDNYEWKYKKNRESAAWIIQVTSYCLNNIKILNGVISRQIFYQISAKKIKLISKGGINSVSKQTGITKPDTILPIYLSVLSFLTQNDEFMKIYVLCYKQFVLNQYVNLFNNFFKEKTEQMKLQKTQNQLIKQKSKKVQHKNLQIHKIIKCCQQIAATLSDKKIKENKYIQIKIAEKQLQQVYNITFKQYIKSIEKPFQYTNEELIKNSQIINKDIKYQLQFKVVFDNIKKEQSNFFPKINFFKNFNTIYENGNKNILKNLIYKFSQQSDKYKIHSQKFMLMRQIQIAQDIVFTLILNELPYKLNFIECYESSQDLYQLVHTYETKVQTFKNQNCDYYIGKRPNHQIYSYLFLFKTCIAIIAFQTQKIKWQNSPYSLKKFMVPIDYDQIYNNFTALSAKAHATAKKIKQYFKIHSEFQLKCSQNQDENRKIKKKLFFKLSNQTGEDTREYINQVFKKDQGMKQKLAYIQQQLESKVDQLYQKISNYHQRYQKVWDQIYQINQKVKYGCPCYQYYDYVWKGRYINKLTNQIQQNNNKINFDNKNLHQKHYEPQMKYSVCQYHIRLANLQKIIKNMQLQSENKIIAKIPQQNPQSIIFFKYLPYDVSSFIDLILLCQIKIKKVINQKQITQQLKHWTKINSQSSIFNTKIQDIHCNTTFLFKDSNPASVWNQVVYLKSDIMLDMKNITCQFKQLNLLSLVNQRDYCLQQNSWTKYKFIIDPPPVVTDINEMYIFQQIRQHKIYQCLSTLPKDIDRNQFILYASLRVTTQTQLTVLLSEILKRNIVIDSYNFNFPFKNIIQAIVSRILSIQQQKQHNKNQIIKFLKSYTSKLSKYDFIFLPILGPIIAFLSQYQYFQQKQNWNSVISISNNNKMVFNNILITILKFALQYYDKIKQQIQRDEVKKQQGEINQKFICFAALCCFTEHILSPQSNNQSNELNELFMLVYLHYGTIKLAQTVQRNSYVEAITKYQNVLDKTLFYNIKSIIEYGKLYPHNFVKIIHKFLKIYNQTQNQGWKVHQINEFSLEFVNNKKKYKLDFCRGILLLNDNEIGKTPQNLMKTLQYKQLFSKCQFEIFSDSETNSLIISKDFKNQFYQKLLELNKIQNNQNQIGSIKFEIKRLKTLEKVKKQKQYTIILNIERPFLKKKQTWIRIPSKNIKQKNGIPQYYRQKYRPWLNQQHNLIAFRQPNLKNLYYVALIAGKENIESEQIKSYIIPNQHAEKNIQFILSNLKKYDELELFDEHQFDFTLKDNKISPQKILSKIQNIKYIHAINSRKNNKIQKSFWLHRYDLKFILNQNGLIPTIMNGYRLSNSPFTHNYLPWTIQQNIRCLVLEKIQQNQYTYQMHKIRVIIPNLQYENGQYIIPQGTNQCLRNLNFFIYDLHDHFYDLRGTSRESQLYLALILTCIHNGIKNQYLNLTSLQYAIDIIKSCLNNHPLSKSQLIKVSKIVEISLQRQYYSMLLMCQILLVTTRQLNQLFIQTNINQKQNFKEKQEFISLQQYWESQQQNEKSKNYIEAISRAKFIYRKLLIQGKIPQRQIIPSKYYDILGLKMQNKQKIRSINQQDTMGLNLDIIQQQISKMESILKHVSKIKNNIIRIEKNNQFIVQNVSEMPKLQLSQIKNVALAQRFCKQLEQSYKSFASQQIIENKLKNIKFKLFLQDVQQAKIKVNSGLSRLQNIIKKIDKKVGILQRNLNLHSSLIPKDYIKIILNLQQSKKSSLLNHIANKQEVESIKKLIIIWVQLKVQADCLVRLSLKLKNQNIDIIQILRECQSPRQLINKKPYWNFFQIQMKLQIWVSQFETFQTLMNSQNGIVTQLNMGEGKTQTIIPMIILYILYENDKNIKTPRINCLSSLYSETYSNFYKFLSATGFRIPLLQLPFQRSLKFTNQTIKSIRRSFYRFIPNAIILLHQTSSHSMILKQRQKYLYSNNNKITNFHYKKDNTIFQGIKLYDIFDQVDALMTPIKQFIYSINQPQKQFQALNLRIKVCRLILQQVQNLCDIFIQQNIAVFDSLKHSNIGKCEYSLKLRITVDSKNNKNVMMNFRRKICENIFRNIQKIAQLDELYREFSEPERKQIMQYIINPQIKDKSWKFSSSNTQKTLYILRGSLAMGVLEHCLSLRFRVQYGRADKKRYLKTKLAVPYQASQVPSKKNEFSHPEVTLYLTYLTYYYEGISYEAFKNALSLLSKQKIYLQEQIYLQWYESLSQQYKNKVIKQIKELELANSNQIQRLYAIYGKNKRVIDYWLQKFVISQQMIHFPSIITSSSWDLSCVEQSVGFSGTKDGSILFPTYIKYKQSENKTIKSTDAKMIDLVLKNSKILKQIPPLQKPLWKLTIDKCIQQDCGCLIDVGAYLSGISIYKDVIPYILKNENFNRNNKFKGITFFNQSNWMVYNIKNKQIIGLRTLIPDHQTFVIFDQYRTRGADFKMDTNINALLTLSIKMAKDDFMQAVGRLRKFGRNQKLLIVMTEQVKKQIMTNISQKYQQLNLSQKLQVIISWILYNSIKQIQNYIYSHSNHAKLFLQNQIIQPQAQNYQIKPQYMYASQLKSKTVKEECQKIFSRVKNVKQKPQKYLNIIKQVQNLFNKYGQNCMIEVSNYDQQTEKQKQVTTQTVKQIAVMNISQVSTAPSIAIPQQKQSVDYTKRTQWKNLFKFQQHIIFTSNFIKCTEVCKNQQFLKNGQDQQIQSEKKSQLQLCYFVFIKKYEKDKQIKIKIVIFTQRQIAIYLRKYKKITIYDPQNDKYDQYNSSIYNQKLQIGVISLLNNLTIESPIIKSNKLQKSLVQIKFFNGVQNYTQNEMKIIHHIIYDSIYVLNSKQKVRNLVLYFMERRYLQTKYYSGSTLEQFVNKMEQNLNELKRLPAIY